MSDVYMPGVKSRFNTEKLIEDLMKLERIPRDRVEQNIDSLTNRKTWWQDLGRRITSLRDSSRMLYSFQNPFNERIALSSDEYILSATATREAREQDYRFTVKQLAQADRLLSSPLDDKTNIEAGSYTFYAGKEEITFNFRGGTLREFVDVLNTRGKDKIAASFITVSPGYKSLLLESKVTGSQNRLDFSPDTALLAISLGLIEFENNTRKDIAISEDTVLDNSQPDETQSFNSISVNEGILDLPSRSSAIIPFQIEIENNSPLALKIETQTKIISDSLPEIMQPPSGPRVPSSGTVSYGGITVENEPSATELPEWIAPPVPPRVNTLSVFSLVFSDGTKAALPAITDSTEFNSLQFDLNDAARGKTITGLVIDNANTHRDIAVKGIEVFNPKASGLSYRPLNAVSEAQDAIVLMEGIQMTRSSNSIDDIIPGVTLNLRGVSDRPVRLDVSPDREAVKNSIFTFVYNYNLLMAELNVLTRNDPSIIDDFSGLEKEELEDMRKRLGAFSGDSTLTQFRAGLQRAVSSPYPTDAERDLALLSQIGIGTNMQRNSGGGVNASQLRGYLEIDDKLLDNALQGNMHTIRQLFGSDTTGDLIVDTGIAFNLDTISRPFVETGGIISLKTSGIDSKVSQDQRRIDTMDRQLARKEAELKIQYSRMESAYERMEQMATSLDNFNQRNNNR